jgi:regulatory protein
MCLKACNMGRDRSEKPRSRPVTEAYLERAALHYLGRFNSSHGNLIRVLERKVRRRNEDNVPPDAEQTAWIKAAADKCVEYGYVDDAVYARQRFSSLLRKGKPLRIIAQDLRYKGVPEDIVNDVMAEAVAGPEENLDLVAAAAYVRRRRFAAFRRTNTLSETKVEKEKSAMMRAGFSYGLVKKIMEASEEELLTLLP